MQVSKASSQHGGYSARRAGSFGPGMVLPWGQPDRCLLLQMSNTGPGIRTMVENADRTP
ncbi:MAG: hypothetical protein ACE5FV_04555 [Woeseia sp.]